MVKDHRLAVADANTRDEINKKFIELSEYEGYKDKMIILELSKPIEEVGKYPFPDLDSNIDEEEAQL